MYFYYTKIVPINTTEDAPVELITKLSKGMLEFVDVGIPRGVNRLAQCRIFYNEFQLVPFNRDTWISGNDITIRVPIGVKLISEPYDLRMICINLDDTFTHELSFGISVDVGQVNNVDLANALSGLLQVQEG